MKLSRMAGVKVRTVTDALDIHPFMLSRWRKEEPSALATWAGLSVLRILIAPLFALVFLLSGGLSSYRVPRLALMGATLLELAVSAYGVYVWFVPLFFHRQ